MSDTKPVASAAQTGRRTKVELGRVLIVDDVVDNLDMYCSYLERACSRIVTATNGEQAIAIATTETFDVIVMDLALPVIDGWEAIRRLKADERTSSVPIIALTGHVEPTFRQRAIDAGCRLFLTKPCLPLELAEAIAEITTAAARAR